MLSLPTRLADDALLETVEDLVQTDRRTTAKLVLHLAEVQRRQLFLEHGYTSLFAMCRERLNMSEGQAGTRVRAARLCLRLPAVAGFVADGRVHLAGVVALVPVLGEDNHLELLERASGRSKRAIEALVAELAPKPERAPRVRKVPAKPARRPARPPAAQPPEPLPTAACCGTEPEGATNAGPALQLEVAPPASEQPFELTPPAQPRGRVQPLGRQRFEVRFTVGAQFVAKLEEVQALEGVAVGDKDLEGLMGRALDLLRDDLRRRRRADTKRQQRGRQRATNGSHDDAPAVDTDRAAVPRSDPGVDVSPRNIAGSATAAAQPETVPDPPPAAPAVSDESTARARRSRHIPAAVRRAVWERDEARCTWVAPDGRRCTQRAGLELDHVVPHARGGAAVADNVRLLCKPHNLLEARRAFGRDWIEQRIRNRTRPVDRHPPSAGGGPPPPPPPA